jgi:ABC-type multidrug transport system fused ATPase/permease subunit
VLRGVDLEVPPAKHLSNGQRVQMLVAQIVLPRPAILIFDEGLTAVHPITRAALRKALRRELPATAIVEVIHEGMVTSRVVTDILVMEGGVIVERGTHADLMQLGGRYAAYVAASQR